MIKTEIFEMVDKRMNRKEFIQYVGIATISLFGFGNVMTHFFDHNKSKHNSTTAKAPQHGTTGFGSSKFGI